MRRSGNCEENKRIIMDLDVVIKSHNCPYIVQCIGTFITTVSFKFFNNYFSLMFFFPHLVCFEAMEYECCAMDITLLDRTSCCRRSIVPSCADQAAWNSVQVW